MFTGKVELDSRLKFITKALFASVSDPELVITLLPLSRDTWHYPEVFRVVTLKDRGMLLESSE